MLEHVERIDSAAHEMFRIMKPGATAVHLYPGSTPDRGAFVHAARTCPRTTCDTWRFADWPNWASSRDGMSYPIHRRERRLVCITPIAAMNPSTARRR